MDTTINTPQVLDLCQQLSDAVIAGNGTQVIDLCSQITTLLQPMGVQSYDWYLTSREGVSFVALLTNNA